MDQRAGLVRYSVWVCVCHHKSLIYLNVVWDHSKSKQKAKQYKQKTSPQSYKTQIKILDRLSIAGFEQLRHEAALLVGLNLYINNCDKLQSIISAVLTPTARELNIYVRGNVTHDNMESLL